MPITRISSQALQVLDRLRYLRIHSVFESAVNLQAGHRLVNCSAGVISVPYGTEMAPADLGRLQRTCRSMPDDPIEWRPQDRALISRIGNVAIIATPTTIARHQCYCARVWDQTPSRARHSKHQWGTRPTLTVAVPLLQSLSTKLGHSELKFLTVIGLATGQFGELLRG